MARKPLSKAKAQAKAKAQSKAKAKPSVAQAKPSVAEAKPSVAESKPSVAERVGGLDMTKKCVHSFAYHKASKDALKEGNFRRMPKILPGRLPSLLLRTCEGKAN